MFHMILLNICQDFFEDPRIILLSFFLGSEQLFRFSFLKYGPRIPLHGMGEGGAGRVTYWNAGTIQ